MFSHIMVGTNDVQKSKQFYDATLGVLGVTPADIDTERQRLFYRTDTGMFGVTKPIDGGPASSANGATVGFSCKTPDEVEAWHAAGVANGGATCEDPPGVRELGPMKLYLAYLRDPDGNKLCALHFMN